MEGKINYFLQCQVTFYASAPVKAVAEGIMFSGCLSHSREHNILGTLEGNFLKFVHLDSPMNWLDFGRQGHCDLMKCILGHLFLFLFHRGT